MPKSLDTFYKWILARNKEYHREAMVKLMPQLCESCELNKPHRYYNEVGVWVCAKCDPPLVYEEAKMANRRRILENAQKNREKRRKGP